MLGLWRHRYRKTTFGIVVCIGFLGGIGLAHTFGAPSLIVAGVCGITLLVKYHIKNLLTLLLVGLLGLMIGWQRGQVFANKLADYQPYYGQEITIDTQSLDDGVYGKNSQITFDADRITLDDGTRLMGKLEISGFGLNGVFQGDEIEATGKLYSGLGQYQGFISYGELALVQHHPSLISDIRRKFTAGMQTALPEPLASFAMGLLIGQRATLPADIKQVLLMVGLTHIIAVSGYNLTIILEASQRILGKRSKRISTGLTTLLIGGFLLLAGASASIVRAAIVSILSIVARYYGRTFKPLLLILLAAVITAWLNPFYLWSDPSWYLSFLAFYGVLVIAPGLTAKLRPRWQESLIAGVAIESICAELMTTPFILFSFGQLSLIGLPANVLVVTLVPLAMLLSAIAGVAGMVSATLAGWLAWPARILLTYMLDVSQLLSRMPGIFRQNLSFRAHQLIASYILLVLLSIGLWLQTKRPKPAIITDKNTIRRQNERTQ